MSTGTPILALGPVDDSESKQNKTLHVSRPPSALSETKRSGTMWIMGSECRRTSVRDHCNKQIHHLLKRTLEPRTKSLGGRVTASRLSITLPRAEYKVHSVDISRENRKFLRDSRFWQWGGGSFPWDLENFDGLD